jgi:hypothetical protein
MKSRIWMLTSLIGMTLLSALLAIPVRAQGQAETVIGGSLQDTAKLITPTLFSILNDTRFGCNLTNVGNKVGTVQVRIISDGVILLDSGEISLPPQHTADYFVDGLPNGGPIYCEFTMKGSKNDYRGDAKLFHLGSSDSVVISAD